MNDYNGQDRLFLRAYIEQFSPVGGPDWSSKVMARIADIEKISVTKAKKATDLALSDIVEDCDDLSQEVVSAIDSFMRKIGATTLGELRIRKSRRLKRILRNGKIRDDFDYYFGKSIVDSSAASNGDEIISGLERLLNEYTSTKIK